MFWHLSHGAADLDLAVHTALDHRTSMNVHFNTCIMAVIIHLFFKLNLNKTRICMQQQYWFLLHCCSCTTLHGNLLVSSKELTTVLGVCLQWQRILLGSRHGMTTVKNGRPFLQGRENYFFLIKKNSVQKWKPVARRTCLPYVCPVPWERIHFHPHRNMQRSFWRG